MADPSDDEVKKLEERVKALKEIQDKELLEAGKNAIVDNALTSLERSGLRVNTIARFKMDKDTTQSIEIRVDGKQVRTHRELTDADEIKAVLKNARIEDDGVKRKVYLETTKVKIHGINGDFTVDRNEYIISKEPPPPRGQVFPKAVFIEEVTKNADGKFVGKTTMSITEGKPIETTVKYDDGKQLSQTIEFVTASSGLLNIKVETIKTDGKETTSQSQLYDKSHMRDEGKDALKKQQEAKEALEKELKGKQSSNTGQPGWERATQQVKSGYNPPSNEDPNRPTVASLSIPANSRTNGGVELPS